MSFCRKLFLINFLFILFIFNNFSYANYYSSIKVCSEAGFIPFEMKTTDGKWEGYDIALIKQFPKYWGLGRFEAKTVGID